MDGPFKFAKRFAVKVNQGPHPPISWLKGVRYWEGELREERNIKVPDPLSVTELYGFKKNWVPETSFRIECPETKRKKEKENKSKKISVNQCQWELEVISSAGKC